MTERGGNIKMNRCSAAANLVASQGDTAGGGFGFWVLSGFWGSRGEFIDAYLIGVVERGHAR